MKWQITNERVARVGYNYFISNKGEWNNCFSKFSTRVLPPVFISTILQSVRKEHTASGHTRITWLLHNKKLNESDSYANDNMSSICGEKPSSNYFTGKIQGKQTILEVFKWEWRPLLVLVSTGTVRSNSRYERPVRIARPGDVDSSVPRMKWLTARPVQGSL